MYKPNFKISGAMEWVWVGAAGLLAVSTGAGRDPADNFGEGQNALPIAAGMIIVTKMFELVWSYYVKLVDLAGKSVQGQLKETQEALDAFRQRWDAREAEHEERIAYIYNVAKKREADYEQRVDYLYKERDEFAKERAEYRAADEAKTRTVVALHEKFMELTARVVANNAALLADRLTPGGGPREPAGTTAPSVEA